MKTVELRRHADNDGDQLSDEGVQAARQIGSTLTAPYDLFVSSGAQRATQTVEIWQQALGDSSPIQQEPGLRSEHEDRWRQAYQQAGSGELARMRDVEPAFVDAESATLGAALGGVFDRIPEGGAALVCGHSPTNEAAVLGLTGVIVDPIDKGAGVRVEQSDDGSYRVRQLT
ncbi:MAG: histidine phosphatase family protein [Nocardioidaceae bacterium]|nr:histidine phosphatase family protein [Nocardioidaceae bacterium]